MIIKEASLIPFSLKFNSPFKNSKSILKHRNGIILKLTDEFGNISYGECSPLEGFSKENINDVDKELKKFCKDFFYKKLENEISNISLLPSVNFCIEQAFNSLLLQRNIENKNNFQSKKEIKLNAVVGLVDIKEALQLINKKINNGFDTFKLKVGRENPYDDFLLIEKVREIFGYEIKIRLDANQKWSCDEAIEYISNFEQFQIEYIEEPCSNCCSNLKTMNSTDIHLAADESLVSFELAQDLISSSQLKYFIIKPMTIGFNNTLKLIDLAERLNKTIIISSSFESAVGKSGLVFLAAQTKHDLAHGLDTSEYFEKDICEDPFQANNSIISFDINNYPPKFNL